MIEYQISSRQNPSLLKIAAPGILWLSLAAAGLWFVSDYENTPGVEVVQDENGK